MAASMVATLAPTALHGGLATSLAFQRTDVVVCVLAVSWLSLAAAGAGVSRAAIAIAAAALAVALLGLRLIGDHPILGAGATPLLLGPPVVALAFAAWRKWVAAKGGGEAASADLEGEQGDKLGEQAEERSTATSVRPESEQAAEEEAPVIEPRREAGELQAAESDRPPHVARAESDPLAAVEGRPFTRAVDSMLKCNAIKQT